MTVTLNTDASFYLKKDVAGYAMWIETDDVIYKKWGKLKTANDITQSEMRTIANGLYFIRNHPYLKLCTKIVINTDSEQSILGINKKAWVKDRKNTEILRSIRETIYEYLENYDYELNKVSSHSTIDSVEAVINDWCDRHAKKGAKL